MEELCFFLPLSGEFDLSRDRDRRPFDCDKDGDDECLFLFLVGEVDLELERD